MVSGLMTILNQSASAVRIKRRVFLLVSLSIVVYLVLFFNASFLYKSSTHHAVFDRKTEICKYDDVATLRGSPPEVSNNASSDMPELSNIWDISPETRQLLSRPKINNFTSSYIHSQKHTCGLGHTDTDINIQKHKYSETQVDIIFVVPSAPGNVKRRQAVRSSELYSFVKNTSNKAALLFFIGAPDPTKSDAIKQQSEIDGEVAKHSDIVQETFTDIYRNILVKSMAMLRWVNTFCYSAKYVIRTDDDIEVKVEHLTKAIQYVDETQDNFILGYIAKDWDVHRRNNDKYFVPEVEYKCDKWPTFALGGLLGYTTKTARLLYEAALRLKPVWLDDVFITGICGNEINATLVSHSLFIFKHYSPAEKWIFWPDWNIF